ncbi:MAG: DUF6282 family protein [Acidobacteriota bacterium]
MPPEGSDSGRELEGVFDLHVHAGPDVRPRKMSGHELARQAGATGMGGLLIKNHHTATVGQATMLSQSFTNLKVFGGLVLNSSVGGLNPEAAEAALRMGAVEIWMPTLSAENECSFRGRPGSGIAIRTAGGQLKEALWEILKLVAEYGAVLGTGHLSPRETALVIEAGKDVGVKKFLVTHPEIRFVNMSLSQQRELCGPGVYFERCYVREGFCLDWDGLANVIREMGLETTVLASDLGQPENPDPVTGMKEMIWQLSRRSFSREELQIMTCRNPARLLDLD